MYPTALNTNEVKDKDGVEVEFVRRNSPDGKDLVFAKVGEAPNLPHRITTKHSETGAGVGLVRRSVVRVDKSFVGQVDSTRIETDSTYIVKVSPVGNMTAFTESQQTMANLLSFCASKGLTTTILFDGSGYGAEALINGTL